jgi:cell pole-organizing protein PopZ
MNTATRLDVESIDQILEKIKKAINSDIKNLGPQATTEQTTSEPTEDPEVLELTNVVARAKADAAKASESAIDAEGFDLISQHVQNFTRKLNLLMQGNYVVSEKEVREIFKETLRPYLKSWLNNNLRDLVKEVLEAEVKRVFKKII